MVHGIEDLSWIDYWFRGDSSGWLRRLKADNKKAAASKPVWNWYSSAKTVIGVTLIVRQISDTDLLSNISRSRNNSIPHKRSSMTTGFGN